jgi:hypothetical protein
MLCTLQLGCCCVFVADASDAYVPVVSKLLYELVLCAALAGRGAGCKHTMATSSSASLGHARARHRAIRGSPAGHVVCFQVFPDICYNQQVDACTFTASQLNSLK